MINPFKQAGDDLGPFAKGPGMAETMVAKMLGFTPEEMHATLTDFRATIVATAERMERIEQKLDAIIASQSEVISNDDGNDGDSVRRGNGGTVLRIGGPSGNGNGDTI